MQKSNLLSLDKAIKKIKLSFNKISSEDIFLQNALGRCLSKPIVSNVDNPKYDVSAMDGYAINYNNYVKINKKVTKKLKVIGESSAGNPFPKKIENLETVRIFTGAKLPLGSDSIIIQEDINNSSNKNFVETTINIKKNQYVRKKGLDFKKNEILFNEGTIIKSRHIGSIAMTGQTWLTVSRKPVVSILSTGNEILRVGEQQKKDKIPNGNSLMLASMVKEFGGIPKILPVASDNELDIYDILNSSTDCDLIITTGGVSVGKYDLIQKALENFSRNKTEFWKIAMRPGKPLLFSKINKTPLIGLPGNPVSSGVCCLIFVNIAIRSMLGDTNEFPIFENAILNGELSQNDQRFDFVRANINYRSGNAYVTPITKQDSSMITKFSYSDCLITREPFDQIKSDGDIVKIFKFPNNI